MSTDDDRLAQIMQEKLALILESSSSTYVPHALGDAYAQAIVAAAEDPDLAEQSVPLLEKDDRTVAALSELPFDELSERCRDVVEEDPRGYLEAFLGAEEAEYWSGPEGGMNSGTAAATYVFTCNGLRYLYEWDFDGAGSQFWCGDGHDVSTPEGKAAYEAEIADWAAQFEGIYDD